MDTKQFLIHKGIFDTQYIFDCDGESINIETLLIEYQTLQLLQANVSNQRELLFAFEKMRTEHIIGATDEWRYSNVDLFLNK